MIFLILLGAALIALIAVILWRTVRFTPNPQQFPERREIQFDFDGAVSALQQLIRCKTVSNADPALEDSAEFEKLVNLLPELYPQTCMHCAFHPLPDRGLLFVWKGQHHNAPSVMMAHYDVVPADAQGWEKPPFEGVVENGVLWGRGALDTKVTFNAILSAAEHLIQQGFVPENDIYFAFSGGEEVSGNGAVDIVHWFEDHHITPALVVDEGGAVVEGVFPGVKAPCGLIGIAEKGMMNLTFAVKSSGGHASAPGKHTPIGQLAQACTRVENHPFPMHMDGPARKMFDTLGRHSSFLYRMIFANLWLFGGVLDRLSRKSGGEMNALLRTTVAFTQATGSAAPNVIPPEASMTANLRLNPRDSVQSATERIRHTIGDDAITLTPGTAMEPSPVSETDCAAYQKVASAVSHTWPGCVVAPYLMVQCSDSRHYRNLSNHVYRFSAMDLTHQERATIHGHNERIRLETLHRSVEFYIRLMSQC